MNRSVSTLMAFLAAALIGAVPVTAQPQPHPQSQPWNAEPWLQDLQQVRVAIDTKYANLEYLLVDRAFDLDGLFARAEAAIRQGSSDSDAIAVFDRLASRIGDEHVRFSWPRRPASAPPSSPNSTAAPAAPAATVESFCRAQGYDVEAPGVGPALPGYTPLVQGDELAAGLVPIGETRAGIMRIGKFEPGLAPSLCAKAVAELRTPIERPCDDNCRDSIQTHVYRSLTAMVEDRLRALRASGAQLLVVDVAGNGGGSEWVEAVARMLSRRQLTSQRMGFVRGPHWVRTWSRLAERLRGFAEGASRQDRAQLLAWAAEADAAKAEAERRCPPTGGCPWLGRAGFATGLVGQAPAGAFAGKEWGPWVFNPAQYPYHDGVWDGPLIVLVDQNTASAAEEFAAMLQDNRAAVIVGSRTAGLGCGYTWGGTPTQLPNSGGTLHLPDCARFRADGSNEVIGVIPDRLIAWRPRDGQSMRARMLLDVLPEAAEQAVRLYQSAAGD